jgi:AcrR family transcriptional regulator
VPDDGRNGGADEGGSGGGESVAERERLIDAFTRVAAERGYEDTTVEAVVEVAGLTEADFQVHFSDMRQCLSAAYEVFVGRLIGEAREAMAASDEWPVQVREGVAAGFAFVSETAARSRFFAVDALAAGPAALGRYGTLTDSIVELMRGGREQRPQAADLPDLLEPILAGGLTSFVTGILLTEENSRLLELEAEVVEILLTPYLGREEARRIAA